MHGYEAATMKHAGSGPRFLLTLVLFVSFFLQSYVTQTHIHLAPASAATTATHTGTSATKPADHDKHPGDEDPAHCPFCQAVAASGNLLTPVAILLPLPILSSPVEKPVSHTPSHRSPLPHSWQGRAPPRI